MKDCVFCEIVEKKIQSYKIYEDKKFLVFLDAFPSMIGQTLVIPKKHFEYSLFDLDKKTYNEILILVKKVAKAMQES